jgi:selenocysteine-specific elongation factor
VRVRSIHAQNQASDTGVAGQRCALNLAGIAKEDIQRGDWIWTAACCRPPTASTFACTCWPKPRPWRSGRRCMCIGTHKRTAHVALLQDQPIEPGTEARVQLVLDAPVFALPGDRLILRNAQASRTIAGGMVLDPYAPPASAAAPSAWPIWTPGAADGHREPPP